MATFPTNLPTTATIPVESSTTPLSTNHVASHQGAQDEIIAIATKVGVDGSAVTTSHDYKLGEVTSTDKAVGKTATQTLTNKTLGSGTTITLGSDAEGDTYYRNSGGAFVRLPRGTDNYILKMNGNVPNWEAETSTVDASTTVKGVVEASSGAELAAGTATGGTGAILVVTPDIVAFSEVGNGADGSLTYDGSTTILSMVPSSNIYTLTRDIYGTTITVNNGVTIETAGYRIYASVSLINNGTIKRTPNNGGNASGITSGTAGAALSSGTIYGGLAGVAGGGGQVVGSTGSILTSPGNAGIAQTESVGVAGVTGGTGGTGDLGDAGGSGGAAGAKTSSVQGINNVTFATIMREFQGANTVPYIKGSSGSGSGAGGTVSIGGAATSGAGGGSGSTGGIVWIAARLLTNNGTISALGGNGGNGSAATSRAGGGGGGAGGSGGIVVLIYKSLTLGTVSVAGGTGGTGGAGATGGGAGASGTNGNTGVIVQLPC